MSDFNQKIIEQFRSNGGQVGPPFEGADLLLLHTTGAKSGEARVNPLAFRAVGDDLVVFGSYAGRDRHPDWFRNLEANPDVTVELAEESYPARARVATGDERHRIWEAQKADVPQFAEYEKTAGREIPVIVLERR